MQAAWDALAGLEAPKRKGAPETHPGWGLYLSSARPVFGGSLMKCVGCPPTVFFSTPKPASGYHQLRLMSPLVSSMGRNW